MFNKIIIIFSVELIYEERDYIENNKSNIHITSISYMSSDTFNTLK